MAKLIEDRRRYCQLDQKADQRLKILVSWFPRKISEVDYAILDTIVLDHTCTVSELAKMVNARIVESFILHNTPFSV